MIALFFFFFSFFDLAFPTTISSLFTEQIIIYRKLQSLERCWGDTLYFEKEEKGGYVSPCVMYEHPSHPVYGPSLIDGAQRRLLGVLFEFFLDLPRAGPVVDGAGEAG